MAANIVINLTAAYRGAAGATAITGARRARVSVQSTKKVSRAGGSELPDGVWVKFGLAQAAIEAEDTDEWFSHLTAAEIDEILKLYYDASGGARIMTCKWARLAPHNELAMERPEQGENVSRSEIVFNLIYGTGVTQLSEAITDAAA